MVPGTFRVYPLHALDFVLGAQQVAAGRYDRACLPAV